MARLSRNPERSYSPSSTVFNINFFQKTACLIFTVYGAILPLVLMCHKAIIQSSVNTYTSLSGRINVNVNVEFISSTLLPAVEEYSHRKILRCQFVRRWLSKKMVLE